MQDGEHQCSPEADQVTEHSIVNATLRGQRPMTKQAWWTGDVKDRRWDSVFSEEA